MTQCFAYLGVDFVSFFGRWNRTDTRLNLWKRRSRHRTSLPSPSPNTEPWHGLGHPPQQRFDCLIHTSLCLPRRRTPHTQLWRRRPPKPTTLSWRMCSQGGDRTKRGKGTALEAEVPGARRLRNQRSWLRINVPVPGIQ